MDNNYIITSTGTFISESDLQHHGIRGMKWGVRRYQNPDGSLTTAGRKRYGDGDSDEKSGSGRGGRDGKSASKSTGPKSAVKPAKKVDQADKDKAKTDEGKKQEETKKSDSHEMSTLSLKDIKAANDRLQSEDTLKNLLEKRGYKVSLDDKSETDRLIDSLTKEKQIKQLQKDIAEMTKEKSEGAKRIAALTETKTIKQLEKDIADLTPKKVSKISKFLNSESGKSLTTQLVKSGENVLIKYIERKLGASNDSASAAVRQTGKALGKEADSIKKSVTNSINKQKQKEEKRVERQAKREERRKARREAWDAEMEATRAAQDEASAKLVNSVSKWFGRSASSTGEHVSTGRTLVSEYKDTPVGSLPAPKDDD